MLLALLLLHQSAVGPIGTPAKAASPAPRPVDKVVCRSEFEATSRIPVRICRTQAERDMIYKQTQADLQNTRNDRTFLAPVLPDR